MRMTSIFYFSYCFYWQHKENSMTSTCTVGNGVYCLQASCLSATLNYHGLWWSQQPHMWCKQPWVCDRCNSMNNYFAISVVYCPVLFYYIVIVLGCIAIKVSVMEIRPTFKYVYIYVFISIPKTSSSGLCNLSWLFCGRSRRDWWTMCNYMLK